MRPRFSRGLVIGKFAPLHRGHEHLIQTALAQCSELYVISYSDPELPGCGVDARRRWLSELFPRVSSLIVDQSYLDHLAEARGERACTLPPNSAPEREHRRFVGWLCRAVWGVTVEAVFTSERYGEGFARELQSYFRELDPLAPAVEHVLVDLDRTRVPISGSELRRDLQAARRWLSPVVYATFVRRVCLLGGESSGKTSLLGALAQRFGTSAAAEYGRERWLERSGQLRFEDMLQIAETQLEREEQAARSAARVTFGDTSPLTTLWYSRELFGRADPKLEALAERPYDLTLLCAPDFPFVQDGTRGDSALRSRQHAFYLIELRRRGTPWLLVTGTPAERLARAEAAVTQLLGA